MAVLAAIAVPNFRSRFPSQITEKFISDLNSLSGIAWQNAILTGRLNRVVFNFSSKKIYIESEKKEAVDKGIDENEAFEPVVSVYSNDYIYLPSHLEIVSFFVDGKNEMEGSLKDRSWYFITNVGISQEVIVNIEDKSKPNLEEPDIFGLVLNPFSAQFKKHETIQEPI